MVDDNRIMVKWYCLYGKRFFDLCFSIPVFLILLPFMAILALLIRFNLGCPIFFKQKRPGKFGRPFILYKFRTMTDECDKDKNLIPDVKRLKSLGLFLRKMSLDELPELLNVIKGDMSLVGPRPLLMQYLPCYTSEQARRHNVKPGITGWAQIHGRNNTPFSKRFEMDVWYVDNISFLLDLRIIITTVIKVIKIEGVRIDLDKCYCEVNDCGLPSELAKVDKD